MVEVGEVAHEEFGLDMESMVVVELATPAHGAAYSAARGDELGNRPMCREATAPNQQ